VSCPHGPEHLRTRPSGVRECSLCKLARDQRWKMRSRIGGRPLVFATRSAIDAAARLLPLAVLENAATGALKAGRYTPTRTDGGDGIVDLGDVVAVVKRARSPFSGRAAWTVVGVRPRGDG